jgi:hypothetical protein
MGNGSRELCQFPALWLTSSPLILFGRGTDLGRLAQLVRAPALHAGGRWFEPGIAHHIGGSSASMQGSLFYSFVPRGLSPAAPFGRVAGATSAFGSRGPFGIEPGIAHHFGGPSASLREGLFYSVVLRGLSPAAPFGRVAGATSAFGSRGPFGIEPGIGRVRTPVVTDASPKNPRIAGPTWRSLSPQAKLRRRSGETQCWVVPGVAQAGGSVAERRP